MDEAAAGGVRPDGPLPPGTGADGGPGTNPGWARPEVPAPPGAASAPPPGPYAAPPPAVPAYGPPPHGPLPPPPDPTVAGWPYLPAAGATPLSGPAGPPDLPGVEPGRRRRFPLGAVVALVAVLSLLSGLVGGGLGYLLADRRDEQVLDADARLDAPARSAVERPAGSVAEVAERLLRSVVSVSVRGEGGAGTGSGFVIRDDGYLLTNNHVVDAAEGGGILVKFQSGSATEARVVGRSRRYDLAVLKVDARNLPEVALADSDDVVVGSPVIAAGSPLGLSGTITTGIVSAKNRPVTAGGGAGDAAYINAIQTDAAINPGNSGGPLVDARGRVIGVNSAIATLGSGLGQGGGAGGSIGLGFSIPMNQARRTAEQIIRTGRATHPVIGVSLDPAFEGEGARIAREPRNGTPPVVGGGPGERAGLQPGDVITRVGELTVTKTTDLIVAVSAHAPGDTVEVRYQRAGRDQPPVRVTLGEQREE